MWTNSPKRGPIQLCEHTHHKETYLALWTHSHSGPTLHFMWTNPPKCRPTHPESGHLQLCEHTHHKVDLCSSVWTHLPQSGLIPLKVNKLTNVWTYSAQKWIYSALCEHTHTPQSGPFPPKMNELTPKWTYWALWKHTHRKVVVGDRDAIAQDLQAFLLSAVDRADRRDTSQGLFISQPHVLGQFFQAQSRALVHAQQQRWNGVCRFIQTGVEVVCSGVYRQALKWCVQVCTDRRWNGVCRCVQTGVEMVRSGLHRQALKWCV